MPHRVSLSGNTDQSEAEKDAEEIEVAAFFGEQFEIQLAELEALLDPNNPEMPPESFWEKWRAIFLAFLTPKLAEWAIEAARAEILASGIGVSVEAIIAAANNWASTFGFNLVTGINESSRQLLQRELVNFFQSTEPSLEALITRLTPQFGAVRAEMIAITEVTRGFEQGTLIYTDELRKIGIGTDLRWHTFQDERVCPICVPNEGKLRSEGWTVSEIPAHPRDRCWTTIEVIPG